MLILYAILGIPSGEGPRGRSERASEPGDEAAADALLPSDVGNVLKGIFGR
jgi:hypothetical protein